MSIDVKHENGTAICTLEGNLIYGSIDSIRAGIDRCLEEHPKKIIIDLTHVDYLDSVGLSLLMRCHARMVRTAGKCVLVGLSGNVERVFKMMKLETVLTVASTLEEAQELQD